MPGLAVCSSADAVGGALPTGGGKQRRSRSRSLVRARKRRRAAEDESAETETMAARPRRRSSDFEQYAAAQRLVPYEEKQAFFSALRRPLPLAFRIRSCDEAGVDSQGPSAQEEWEELHTAAEVECRRITGVAGAWQITLGRDELYQPHLYRLRKWLASSTASGRIVRQEAVSMIPVMLLRIRRQHAVLDMCASPGSKTSQALDALYDDSAPADQKDGLGFVIANDSNAERGYVLAKRLAGLGRRACSAMVVTHDGTKFPNVLAPLRRRPPNPQVPYSRGAFDRIVCDVPCSGDGTIRKDHKVWKVWHPGYGHSLHPLQLRIAMRGVSLLKVGGLMTYSTCSFNPVENEAVVATLLERGRGCLELVDPSPILRDHFAWRTGWTTWTVLDDDFVTYAEPSAAPQLPKTIWPPQSKNIVHALKRCVRMMPHDNDTVRTLVSCKTNHTFTCSTVSHCTPINDPLARLVGLRFRS
jgi:tRNA (cytosine34-C5)-methyltransferase